ncbi:MAG: DUF748 domain-containing protein [Burkholderiaceae bacterium]|nr:DUF748 domain-containing protein [Burkholderiaceae bacterium]
MRMASQAVGRTVSVDDVAFQPWRLGVVVEGLTIAGPQSGAATAPPPPLLHIARVDTALSLRSLWYRCLVLESLQIDAPQLTLSRLGSGAYDIDDLIQRFKPDPKAPPSQGGLAWGLYNIELRNGAVHFNDRPASRQHQLTELNVSLPFVSDLEATVQTHVRPHLSAKLNGVALDSLVDARPFLQDHEGRLHLEFTGFDFEPYRVYWPASLPVQLRRGLLDAKLDLVFEQAPGQAARVDLTGQLNARQFEWGLPQVAQAQQAPAWLSWNQLQVGIEHLQPLARQVVLGQVVWQAPVLDLRRDAKGRLGLPGTAGPEQGAAVASSDAHAPVWRVSARGFAIRDAQVHWQDLALGDAADPVTPLQVQHLDLTLDRPHWPLTDTPVPLTLKAELPAGPGTSGPAGIEAKATLSKAQALLALQWHDLDVSAATPYLQAQLSKGRDWHVRGAWSGGLSVQLAQPLSADTQDLKLELSDQLLRDLALQQGTQTRLGLEAVQLDRVTLAGADHTVQVGALTLKTPWVNMGREHDGSLSLPQLATLPAGKPVQESPAPHREAHPATEQPWRLVLDHLKLDHGQVDLRDALPEPAQSLSLQALNLELSALRWGDANAKPAQLSLEASLVPGTQRNSNSNGHGGGSSNTGNARTGTPSDRGAAGRLQWKGQLALAPLAVQGQLRAERVPLYLANAYLSSDLGLAVQHAEAGFKGRLSFNQPPHGAARASVEGDVLLSDFSMLQTREVEGRRELGEQLLGWQALALRGTQLRWQSDQPLALAIRDVDLSDFFARMIVDEQGHFNLKDLGPQSSSGGAQTEAPVSGASAAVPAVSAASIPSGVAAAPPQVQIGGVHFHAGHVDFFDHFIKPNYSAQLTDLQGSLGAFTSTDPRLAALRLSGRVAGTGLLDIAGSINPLAKPLALDLTANATDIELAPMSPYAGKYVGFGIERGKLSTHLTYHIAPGGALEAQNQMILNQLTFGDAVDSPDAIHLPIKLAVALLKDRNGVIDVNLPVSGSINDPQFSVGGIVVKLILNLIGKALTAPFSLLSGSGSNAMSQVQFEPGSVLMHDPAALDGLAKTMDDRPQLELSITGWVDLDAERQAMQGQWLDEQLLAERRRELQREQTDQADKETQAALQIDDAQRGRLLRQVYRSRKVAGQPRNALGMLKDVPDAQMRAILMASHAVDADGAKALALQRSVALRDALMAKGVASARLFLGAPKLHQEGEDAAADPGGWVPHAELGLSAH